MANKTVKLNSDIQQRVIKKIKNFCFDRRRTKNQLFSK